MQEQGIYPQIRFVLTGLRGRRLPIRYHARTEVTARAIPRKCLARL